MSNICVHGLTHVCYHSGARIEYIPQGSVEPLKKGMIQHETPNILTNPIKKGGFGIPNTTIGVPPSGGDRRSWLQSVRTGRMEGAGEPGVGVGNKCGGELKKWWWWW